MIKARPTEYKGIKYRSKCEAIFARMLDVSKWPLAYIYEPEQCGIIFHGREWYPDFSVMWLRENRYWIEEILEYKSFDVTDTTKDELAEKFDALEKPFYDVPHYREYFLYCINPYENDVGYMQQYYPGRGWGDEKEAAGLHAAMRAAMDYRFDKKYA